MALPFFIDWFAKKIGKSVSAFTKSDWKRAAITIAEWHEKAIPVPGRPGRPRKRRHPTILAALLSLPKRRVGRPIQRYGKEKLTIDKIAHLIDWLLSKEAKKEWPNEPPRSQVEATRSVLKAFGHSPSYAESVLRSVRSFRKKSANKR